MAAGHSMDALLQQRKLLVARIEQEQEQLEHLRRIVDGLEGQITSDERMLSDIDSALGRVPQMRLDDANIRLRGRRLEEVAIRVLAEEIGPGIEVHYRQWFELLRQRGHLVAGKAPVNTFLAQLNRSSAVERVGKRTGRYKLAA